MPTADAEKAPTKMAGAWAFISCLRQYLYFYTSKASKFSAHFHELPALVEPEGEGDNSRLQKKHNKIPR
jgi:hypothetical protein